MNPTPARPLALVTGASSGIGYELARLFAADGHDVIITATGMRTYNALGIIAVSGVLAILGLEAAIFFGVAMMLAATVLVFIYFGYRRRGIRTPK